MNERTIELLEFEKIRELLAKETSFGPGRDAALNLEPSADREAVERGQRETTEARYLLDRGHAVPLGGLRDIRPFLERVAAGDILEPSHLLDIAQTCEGASNLRKFLSARRENGPTLDLAAAGIGLFQELVAEIRRCITDRAEVADNASRKLQQIRNSTQTTLGRIREKLEAIIRSADYRKVLQDPIITLRQDRYVVPVRSEYKESLPGVVHDRSASGVTLFIEPLSVVPLNNDLRQLAMEERDEIARILRELTDAVARHSPELDRTVRALGHLDLCFAKSRLSGRLDAVSPLLGEEGTLDLRQARHPLLRVEPPGEVVPVDVRIGLDFDTVVITGPNTGGKTVTLKTVGLLTLMAMSGLHIPAAEGSTVSVFRGVWADIGDEQSIEQNLSTFSSHLQNIISIIEHLGREGGRGHLVLLDEIGAGTDPVEGAALAMALLDHFHRSGARMVATTHYSEIKAFVYERDRMVNASVEFDVETLAPTYRLTIGLPGKSNALEISRRLGLPESIIDQARTLLKGEEHDMPALIQQLEEDRMRAQEELRVAREASREAREMQEEQARKWANLRASEEKVLEKAREEARSILRTARMEAAGILGRLRETEGRLAAIAAGESEPGETGTEGGPGAGVPEAGPLPESGAAPLPLDSRRRLDRLEQAARDILASAEKRARALSPEGLEETAGVPGAPGAAGPEKGTRPTTPRPTGAGVAPPAGSAKPGKTFYVAGLRHFGEVIEAPDEGGMVGLLVGSMRLTIHISDLRVPGKAGVPEFRTARKPAGSAAVEVEPPARGGVSTSGAGAALSKAMTVSPEIHLRGLTVEEALGRLDKYLDDALLAGLNTVRVIHGRGTGILRQAVTEYLNEHPDVRTHYIAEQAEGGIGATVVLLGSRKAPGGAGIS
jgi:DNA mismatch repair protein MutS2